MAERSRLPRSQFARCGEGRRGVTAAPVCVIHRVSEIELVVTSIGVTSPSLRNIQSALGHLITSSGGTLLLRARPGRCVAD